MIDHIYLPVSDLNRSSEFYKKVLEPLGIDMPYKFDQPPMRATSHARFRHHNETRPDEKYSPLAIDDLGVVLPQHFRSLRNQQEIAGHGVIDVLGHGCDRFSWQVRIDPRHERRRDDGSCHRPIGRARLLEQSGGIDLRIQSLSDNSLLVLAAHSDAVEP